MLFTLSKYVYSDRGPRRLLPKAGFSANGEAPPLTWLPLTRNPSADCWFASLGAAAGVSAGAAAAPAAGVPAAPRPPAADACTVGLGLAGAGADGLAGAEPTAAVWAGRGSASTGACTVACISLKPLSFSSKVEAAPPGATVTSCLSVVNPDISNCTLQVPSARSGKEYVPIPSVIAFTIFSPWVAVTATPGTGKPPKVTWPCCSEASNIMVLSQPAASSLR